MKEVSGDDYARSELSDLIFGRLGSSPGTWLQLGDGPKHYLRSCCDAFHLDSRKDEDPRHQWRRKGLPFDLPPALLSCYRCGRNSVDLVDEWVRGQGFEWDEATVWEDSDPRHRTLAFARSQFENSQCDGERRKRDGWVPGQPLQQDERL